MTEERQLFITPKKFYALLLWEYRWYRLKDWVCKQQDMLLIPDVCCKKWEGVQR